MGNAPSFIRSRECQSMLQTDPQQRSADQVALAWMTEWLLNASEWEEFLRQHPHNTVARQMVKECMDQAATAERAYIAVSGARHQVEA